MRPFLPRAFFERPLWTGVSLWILAAMAVVVPLFVVPAAQDSFVLPKRALLAGAALLLAAAVGAQASFGYLARIPLHPVNALLVAMIGWQALSAVWSAAPAMAWDQVRETAAVVVVALCFQSVVVRQRGRLLALAGALGLAAAIAAVWVLAVDSLAAFGSGTVRVRQVLGDWRDVVSTASFGNSGHVADFISLGFLLTLGASLWTRSRLGFRIGAMVLWVEAAALVVAWSVHTNVALIVAAVLMAVLMKRDWLDSARRRVVLRRLAILAAGWAAVVAFYVVDHPVNPHGSRVWAGESGGSGGIVAQAFSSERWKIGGSTRLAIWLTTLEIVKHHPWLGAGAGNLTYVYPSTRSEIVASDPGLAPYASSWTNAAHNDVLQAWAETGIVGAFLLVMVAAVGFHAMLRGRGEDRDPGNRLILAVAVAMLTAMCLQAQMNFVLELPVSSCLFFVLVSVPAVLAPRTGYQDLLMPVWRDFGPLRVGIMLKNMHVPTEFQVGLEAPRWLAALAAAACIALGMAGAWRAGAPLQSSILYRPFYEQMRALPAPPTGERLGALIARARRALDADPRNVDCRSALSDLLVRAGRYEEALAELALVRERLDAYEVHVREAVALEGLGRREESLEAWRRAFDRQPALAAQFPDRYRAVESARMP